MGKGCGVGVFTFFGAGYAEIIFNVCSNSGNSNFVSGNFGPFVTVFLFEFNVAAVKSKEEIERGDFSIKIVVADFYGKFICFAGSKRCTAKIAVNSRIKGFSYSAVVFILNFAGEKVFSGKGVAESTAGNFDFAGFVITAENRSCGFLITGNSEFTTGDFYRAGISVKAVYYAIGGSKRTVFDGYFTAEAADHIVGVFGRSEVTAIDGESAGAGRRKSETVSAADINVAFAVDGKVSFYNNVIVGANCIGGKGVAVEVDYKRSSGFNSKLFIKNNVCTKSNFSGCNCSFKISKVGY